MQEELHWKAKNRLEKKAWADMFCLKSLMAWFIRLFLQNKKYLVANVLIFVYLYLCITKFELPILHYTVFPQWFEAWWLELNEEYLTD